MNLLLDTHVFIWMDIAPERLSQIVQQAVQDPQHVVYLSAISVWEMQIKTQLGKLHLNNSLPDTVQSQRNNGIDILALRLEHIYALDRLPDHHRDRFDRLLIAQAQHEQFTLVTDDTKIRQYDVPLLWL